MGFAEVQLSVGFVGRAGPSGQEASRGLGAKSLDDVWEIVRRGEFVVV